MATELKRSQLPKVITWPEMVEIINKLAEDLEEQYPHGVCIIPVDYNSTIPAFMLNEKVRGNLNKKVPTLHLGLTNNVCNEIAIFAYNHVEDARREPHANFMYEVVVVEIDHIEPKIIWPWQQ